MKSSLISIRSNSSAQNSKYFVQQSSRKPRQKMPTIYRHKLADKPYYYDPGYNNFNQNPQLGTDRTQALRKTRLDSFVQKQRQQMVMKTGRNSHDDPEWMKTTFNYYKKSNFASPSKSDLIDERNMDILNKHKKHHFLTNHRRNQDSYYRSMIQDQMSQSIELKTFSNFETPVHAKMRSTLSWREQNQRQVSPKVGALETRDYSIRKPLLKIGKNEFIDTYSPFQKF